jgi:hypothetical protein
MLDVLQVLASGFHYDKHFFWDTNFCLFSVSMRRADVTPKELLIYLEFNTVADSSVI